MSICGQGGSAMATRTSSSASAWGRSSRLLLGLLLLAAAGAACAGAPISPELRGEAGAVSFPDLVAPPEGTMLTVLQTKTENEDRPSGPETSQGRFMALYKGFLDPQIYAEGRQVTVA